MENDVPVPQSGRLDLSFIEGHVSDVGRLLELCPNPSCDDIGKLLAVQAAVLQREGLALLSESQDLIGMSKVRRLAIGVDLLRAAETSFMRADKILSRSASREDKLRIALEARRIANAELLERAVNSGLLVECRETSTGVEVDSVSVIELLRSDSRRFD